MNITERIDAVIRDEINNRDREQDMNALARAFFDNLQRNSYGEFGGWGLDDKRPFGNSDVIGDLVEIVFGSYDDRLRTNPLIKEYVTRLYQELGDYLTKNCAPIFA